jgi:hypothetical protein
LDSKGKNYTAHASSSDSGSPNLAKEEIQTSSNTGLDNPPALPPVQSRAPESTTRGDDIQPAKVSPSETEPPPKKAETIRRKFTAYLNIYEGRIVPLGPNQVARVEFNEESEGNGTVRLTEQGNNILEGRFATKNPGDATNFKILSAKTAQRLTIDRNVTGGTLSATDNFGTLLECIYGASKLTNRRSGICEDNRGNKYYLNFD